MHGFPERLKPLAGEQANGGRFEMDFDGHFQVGTPLVGEVTACRRHDPARLPLYGMTILLRVHAQADDDARWRMNRHATTRSCPLPRTPRQRPTRYNSPVYRHFNFIETRGQEDATVAYYLQGAIQLSSAGLPA